MKRLNIDQINILLMLLSCGVAYAIPFELVLISYAFLGPAHYLTEISWLHDRTYFTGTKWIWAPLTVLTVLIIAMNRDGAGHVEVTYICLSLALAVCIGAVLAQRWLHRAVIAGIVLALFLALRGIFPPLELAVAVLLPTFVHIYIFTGLFILSGALKSRSGWGAASFAVFVACGASFLFITPSTLMVSTDFIDRNLGLFDSLVDYMARVFSFGGRMNGHSILAFLSFAYTYHYLNWFSKTEIIKWHLIPRRRLVLIAALYVISIGVYLIDFRTGFIVLGFLSLIHVLLELPLNVVSIKMIGSSLKWKSA